MSIFKNTYFLKFIQGIIIISIVFIFPIGGGVITGFLLASIKDYSGLAKLEEYEPSVPTKIYDVNGELISELFKNKRDVIPYRDIPKNMIYAITSMEDRNFYKHIGFDIQGIIRALIIDIRHFSIVQGGSTLTQQLAKLLFTTRKRNIQRKLLEVWLSFQIERKYSKQEILTMYFNQIYFGHGAYGIEAASKLYFQKHARDMNLAECAMIAALPSAPNKFSPIKNPHLAQKKHLTALKSMVDAGYITETEAWQNYTDFWHEYSTKSLSPYTTMFGERIDKAPYFTEYIRQKILRTYSRQKVYSAGLKIYTTLNLKYQESAQKELSEALQKQNLYYQKISKYYGRYFDENIIDTIDLTSYIFGINSVKLGEFKEAKRFDEVVSVSLNDIIDITGFLFGIDTYNIISEAYRYRKVETGGNAKVEGALISISPKTGYISAMVGGSGFTANNQLNRAMQMYRPPGSGFKPFIYSCALNSRKYTPATTILDAPIIYVDKKDKKKETVITNSIKEINFEDAVKAAMDQEQLDISQETTPNDEKFMWKPDNYKGRFHGYVRLRQGLKYSINIISIKLLDNLGINRVIDWAARILRMSDTEKKRRFPKARSLALGVVDLSPYEMARAFSVFANYGKAVVPISIRYIEDRYGNKIEDYEQKRIRIIENMKQKKLYQLIPEDVAWLTVSLMRSVAQAGGTAYFGVVEKGGFKKEFAGKTGTTNNWKDAWFTGFTPWLCTSIWIGFDKFDISLGRGIAGGVIAAPIWGKYMSTITPETNNEKFKRWIKGIVSTNICATSGLLPTEACQHTFREYFLKGTTPTNYCDICKFGKNKNRIFSISDLQKKLSEQTNITNRTKGTNE